MKNIKLPFCLGYEDIPGNKEEDLVSDNCLPHIVCGTVVIVTIDHYSF